MLEGLGEEVGEGAVEEGFFVGVGAWGGGCAGGASGDGGGFRGWVKGGCWWGCWGCGGVLFRGEEEELLGVARVACFAFPVEVDSVLFAELGEAVDCPTMLVIYFAVGCMSGGVYKRGSVSLGAMLLLSWDG